MISENDALTPRTKITPADLEMNFPEPSGPLLEGPGLACSWHECMRETAVQVNHWLRHHGHEPPPPAWEERFVLVEP